MVQHKSSATLEHQTVLDGESGGQQTPFMMGFAEEFTFGKTDKQFDLRHQTYLGITGTGSNMKDDYSDDK